MTEHDMLERTKDAYSYDRYGEMAWANAIHFLFVAGYTEAEVEWILRSKYMRWAADQYGVWLDQPDSSDSEGMEWVDGSEIITYRTQYGIEIEQD